MISGLKQIRPHRKDYSLVHSFGLTDPKGLPDKFSIFDGREVPNQNNLDTRFSPPLNPMPMGCVAETITFEAGIEDNKLYNPWDFYLHIPPFNTTDGRDIRLGLQTAINRGFIDSEGNQGGKRAAYFNCYGSGAIDDFDAARFGLFINQNEKRGVIIGTYWYWGISPQNPLSEPTYDVSRGTLHCYLVVGWEDDYLIVIPWIGSYVGDKGTFKLSREIYNKLMAQPYTGAFTMTKLSGTQPVIIGVQAWIDHLVYYVRSLFKV